jgi:high affinity sulfate transporter 1
MNKRSKIIPILDWLISYPKEWLSFDLVAGLTTSAVVIPKAMAYAAIAGLPLVVGLYSSLVPLVVYAVLGMSRSLSVTTTSTIAILVASTLSQAAPGGDVAAQMSVATTLALLAGGFLLLGGLLRLGAVANFISEPVLTGFKAGIGLVIVLDQIPKMLGVHFAKVSFFHDIVSIVQHLPNASVPTLVLAAAMLALMIGLEHFAPRVPAPLVTVAAGIVVSYFAGLDRMGIALVGKVQAGLPSFGLPDVSLIEQLWPAAMGIALISFVETAAAGRAFVLPGEPRPEANQELVALGVANLVGSMFHVMPAGGGTSQTAVNRGAGARSQVAGLVTAAVVVATLLFLAPLFRLMPQATLAAVVVVASAGLVSPAEFLAIRKIRTMEFRWAVIAMAGVALLGTLNGVLAAVAVSMLALIYHANHPPVSILGRKPGTAIFRPLSDEHPADETFPGLLMIQTAGSLHFANIQRVVEKIWALIQEAKPKILVLDCSAVPDLEYSALKMLTEGEEKLRESGTILWLTALNPRPLEVIEQAPLGKILGRERMFFNLEQALENFQRRFNETKQGADNEQDHGNNSGMMGRIKLE